MDARIPGIATISAAGPATEEPGTPTPLPTPRPEDAFSHYEVGVGPEDYVLYQVSGGFVTAEVQTTFGDFSHADVAPEQLFDGRVAWVTLAPAFYEGYGYIAPDSGSFEIRAVYTAPDGSLRADVLEPDELTVMPETPPAAP